VKYSEIIADNLSKAGWSWGCVSALDCEGRTIWIADASRSEESVSLCVPMKSWRRFWNWESTIRGGQRLVALRG
jgi:hypothetical protein